MRVTLSLAGVFLICWCGVAKAEPPKKDKAKFELSEDERTLVELTNKEREKHKLPAFKSNRILMEVARAHSANMAKQGEMNHELDGKNPAQRVKEAAYDYSWTGENIAAGERWSLAGVVEAWMNSEHHRENILKEKYEEIGIGVVRASDGKTYYTQVFGTHKKKR